MVSFKARYYAIGMSSRQKKCCLFVCRRPLEKYLIFGAIWSKMMSMNITINGSEQKLNGTKSLNEIIHQFSKDNRRVIAELNGEIVKSPRWEDIILKDGDALELVSFVGGG